MGIASRLEDIQQRIERLRLHYATLYEPPFDLGPIEERDLIWIKGVLAAHIPRWEQEFGVKRHGLDGTYYLCSQDDMAKIIGWDWTDAKRYVAERFDCDDFAWHFKARVGYCFLLNQVGWVSDFTSRHAYNVIPFPDGEAWFFEPQSDRRVEIGSGSYKLESGLVVI